MPGIVYDAWVYCLGVLAKGRLIYIFMGVTVMALMGMDVYASITSV